MVKQYSTRFNRRPNSKTPFHPNSTSPPFRPWCANSSLGACTNSSASHTSFSTALNPSDRGGAGSKTKGRVLGLRARARARAGVETGFEGENKDDEEADVELARRKQIWKGALL